MAVVKDNLDKIRLYILNCDTIEKLDELVKLLESYRGEPNIDVGKLDELLSIIGNKKLGLQKIDNTVVLSQLSEINENLKALSIVETDKTINDSKKNISYIKLTDNSGQTRMLEIYGKNELNELIRSLPREKLMTLTAEELFEYYSKYYYREINFEKFDELSIEKSHDELEKKETRYSKALSEEELAFERDKVQKYIADHYNFNEVPTVGVNSEGETIYTVRDIVIKFSIDNHGERVISVINDNTVKQETTDNQVANSTNDEKTTDEEVKKDYKKIDDEQEKYVINHVLSESELEYIGLENIKTEDEILTILKKYADKTASKEEIYYLKIYLSKVLLNYSQNNYTEEGMNYLSLYVELSEGEPENSFREDLIEKYEKFANELEAKKKQESNDKVLMLKPMDTAVSNPRGTINIILLLINICLITGTFVLTIVSKIVKS